MPIFKEGHIIVIPDSRAYKKLKNKEGRESHLPDNCFPFPEFKGYI